MKYILFIFLFTKILSSFTFQPMTRINHTQFMRQLYDTSKKEEVCKHLGKEINKTSVADYYEEMKFGESAAIDLVVRLLTTGGLDGITDMLKDVAIWLILLVLSILMLLSMIFYLF